MRTVDEILKQAKLNVLSNTSANSKPIQAHTDVFNSCKCNKSIGREKYLKRIQNSKKVK